MKVAIGYPPLKSAKGTPQISQNRQFQWTTSGIVSYSIYPVIPAYAASLLKEKGYQVYWLDGIAEKQTYEQWERKLLDIKPDILTIETKTPVIKYHWAIVKKLKAKAPGCKIVLMGDHVTAISEETMENCPADYVIKGGDYDFGLLSIANHLSKGEKLETGICCRDHQKPKEPKPEVKKASPRYKCSFGFKLNHSLGELPLIDRDLTKWELYAYRNSNFYRAPGAYTMFGRDCWWGKCSFCSWTTLFPGEKYRVTSVKQAIAEVENLVENYQVQEIMDDSGTFPVGDWLREFCREIIRRGYQKKVRINCNMRFNSGLTQKDYDLMGRAGFRFVLYGLESANQLTLDRLNKNLKVGQIEPALAMAKKAGLKPHVTVMVGYPWEGESEILHTVNFTKSLFHKGLVDTMQATVVIPYPGTPLFQDCLRENCLKTLDWNRYDMREPVMKTKMSEEKLLSTVRELYSSSIWNKTFILSTLSQLASVDGWKYVSFQGFKYLGKLLEFK
jgi:anaerobic magnesium-protoporphyrin IX monomethyl ester cyclase